MSDYCPRCRQYREVKIKVSSRKEKTPDEKTKVIKTTSYDCQTCGGFIRSEDVEVEVTGE